MSSHLLPHPLPDNHGRAQWCVSRPKRVVIFVHGFCGSATGTWPDFPGFVVDHPLLSDCDFVYYGYEGKFTQAAISAGIFRDFLAELLGDPSAFANNALPTRGLGGRSPLLRLPGLQYDRIIIVAHSLGAVVARLALLGIDKKRSKTPQAYEWLDRVTLVLFAPAHNGAFTADLANTFLTNQGWDVSNFIGHIALHQSPLIQDLRQESQAIRYLRDQTKIALERAGGRKPGHLAARKVVWAKDEKVVVCLPFLEDEEADVLDADHSTVCKPKLNRKAPFRVLLEALEQS